MRRYRNNKLKLPVVKLPSVFEKQSFGRYLLAAMLIISAVVTAATVNSSLKPIIMKMAQQYGAVAVSNSVNSAVNDVFENASIGYSDIVKLNYSSQGFVTSVEYDTGSVNKLRSLISDRLSSDLAKLKASRIKIPIGSLSNDISLSGKGPSLKVRIVQSSVPEIAIISDFESVGINTVKHDIILRITVKSEIYLPPRREEFSFTQEYVIAQTIIVGNIPSGYADIG